jgi:hypothetical protein
MNPGTFWTMDQKMIGIGLPLDVWRIVANFLQEPSLIAAKGMLPLSHLVRHFMTKVIKQFLSSYVEQKHGFGK